MKRTIINTVALLVLVFVLVPGSILAAGENGLGLSSGHDLDDLWAKVQANHDLEIEDAVLLLESRQITFTDAEEIQTRIHRVVWVGTAVGIRSYADLRVPWNTETSDLEVEVLRTWRDGHWWPDVEKISDTAVVHTLPHALDKADDYTTMRETMLLHDGVELGCIMETVYTITERGVPARGGIFVFPQRDPSVLTELKITAPTGIKIHHGELNGITIPTTRKENLTTTLLWIFDNSDALKKPVTVSPESYEPTVVWSAWKNWQALSESLQASVSKTAVLDPDMIKDFQKKLNPTMSQWERVTAVGEYLNEMVRRVNYDNRFWQFSPRQASQTLSSAYGHDLDRTVLAMALLESAGFTGHVILVGDGFSLSSPKIPRLKDFENVMIRISQLVDCNLNPVTGAIGGPDEFWHHPAYVSASQHPYGPRNCLKPDSYFQVALILEPEPNNSWIGTGHFQGSAVFSPFRKIMAGDDLSSGFLGSLVENIVSGAKVTKAIPIIFNPYEADLAFTFEVSQADGEASELTKFQIGAPTKGLISRIPHDVHLYEPTRATPVMGLGGLTQIVTVRIKVEPEQIVLRPEPKYIHNNAGSFELEVTEEDGWLTLIRTIEISSGKTIPPSDWPDLRTLFLEEADPINGTVWLK